MLNQLIVVVVESKVTMINYECCVDVVDPSLLKMLCPNLVKKMITMMKKQEG